MSSFCDAQLSDIRTNIDKLHLEKSSLDQELERLINKRQMLEQNVDKARSQFNQAMECQNKIQDALQMAKFKMEEVERQTNSLEETNAKMHEKIAKLQLDLESELKREEKHLCNFEDELSQLSYLFLNAVTYYRSPSLEEENQKVQSQTEDLEMKLSEVIGRVESLSTQFEELTSQPSSDPWDLELPLEQRRIVLKMFQDEHRSLQQILERIRQEKADLHQELGKFQ